MEAYGTWKKPRHVCTNTSAQLPALPKNKRKTSSRSTDIRTLSTISPASCRKEMFSKTPKLQKLGVSGNLAELLEEKQGICLFENFQMLDCLENLNLHDQSEKMLKVPKFEKFPRKLRKLALSNTMFEWYDMSILGSLEELEVLKLDDNAFTGEFWEINDTIVFKQLQYLRIGRTNLETWTATEKSFPVLETLILRNCTALEEIPDSLAAVDTLKVMELYHVSETAVDSAREVRDEIHSKRGVKAFNLFITLLPPQAAVHKQTHGQEDVSTSGLGLPSTSRATLLKAPVVEEEDVVGFDSEAKIIKNRLIGGSNNLTIISIEGMAGIGKTTLTKMVFMDRDLQYEFFTRIWIYVSRTLIRRQIFLNILSNFSKEEFHDISERNLANKIKEYLEGGKYFIVLDDVWTEQDWDRLKIAFPNNLKGSRVLVTTRYHHVALHADSTGIPHHPRFLNPEESWMLLQKKVFGKECCHPILERPGKSIARKCNGLPLALVAIASVLKKDSSFNEWKEIEEDPFAVINQEFQSFNEQVKLSYDQLPLHLKHCFIYLAAFPAGYEIAARKLIHLWIAEGFIPLMEGEHNSDLEHKAEKYLKDLVDRNLVMVVKRRGDGQIKTCYIHDTLHEFCKTEAANMNLFQEIERGELVVNKIPRRLCVHYSVLDFLRSNSKLSSRDVLSFLSCSGNTEIPNEYLAVIPKSFPLLRVIDVESLKFQILPKELFHLYQLRYLAISTDSKLLHKHFNKFGELQTLVLNTPHNSLEVKADIWSMPKLRHVLSNTPMQLPPPKNSKGSTYIQTLSTISPSSCTRKILDKTPNLQKLGIRGNLVELMESMGGISLFDNLQKLGRLENLKLLNEGDKMPSFPHPEKFPCRLRKLTLCNTAFEWEEFSILGMLEELEVLKLDDNAFIGPLCDVSNNVFKRLQYLRIGRTDLVSWTASKDSFPVLKYLYLVHCTSLDVVPSAFGEVESLKTMDLFCINKNVASSAREIQKLKLANENAEMGKFHLSIYPPDH